MVEQTASPFRVFHSPQPSPFVGVGLLLGIAVLALIVALYASGCGGGGDDKTVILLIDRDHGTNVSASQGEKITVSLPSDVPTGYEWAVAQNDDRVLTFLSSDFDSRSSNATGTGGTQILRFSAAQAGETTLELKYWRPSEGESSIVDRYLVTITVTAN